MSVIELRTPSRTGVGLRTYSAGARVADIATHTRLGSRTLWDRRQRAERRLVDWAACA